MNGLPSLILYNLLCKSLINKLPEIGWKLSFVILARGGLFAEGGICIKGSRFSNKFDRAIESWIGLDSPFSLLLPLEIPVFYWDLI